jgi:hypothetical protein
MRKMLKLAENEKVKVTKECLVKIRTKDGMIYTHSKFERETVVVNYRNMILRMNEEHDKEIHKIEDLTHENINVRMKYLAVERMGELLTDINDKKMIMVEDRGKATDMIEDVYIKYIENMVEKEQAEKELQVSLKKML